MHNDKIKARFTIQFNRNDPRHVIAVDILNDLRPCFKSQYIVDAIMYYENRETHISNNKNQNKTIARNNKNDNILDIDASMLANTLKAFRGN